ncbi:MAG: AbrB/MazE/SpoVT family DNA-binding domain-containing protein [Cyclobacteriaceae bacterium]
MVVKLIRKINSVRLPLPKELLDRYALKDKVELTLESDHIIIRPIKKPREGWGIAFEEMHDNQDDNLLINDVFDDEHFDD